MKISLEPLRAGCGGGICMSNSPPPSSSSQCPHLSAVTAASLVQFTPNHKFLCCCFSWNHPSSPLLLLFSFYNLSGLLCGSHLLSYRAAFSSSRCGPSDLPAPCCFPLWRVACRVICLCQLNLVACPVPCFSSRRVCTV
ncbi:hypothetical protein KSP39_PZI008117 [Platanthera zijinensis]|uniref:Uncharacterized protein n=1 Tax=Platanthera zijinensis TaxID=2320716 RepID=A0AAP0G995_9ASPA